MPGRVGIFQGGDGLRCSQGLEKSWPGIIFERRSHGLGQEEDVVKDDHGIEVGAGLGPLAGKVWRVGLMGESSKTENVEKLLGAMEPMLAATAA